MRIVTFKPVAVSGTPCRIRRVGRHVVLISKGKGKSSKPSKPHATVSHHIKGGLVR